MKDNGFTGWLSHAAEGIRIWKPVTKCWLNEVFEMANIFDQMREINQRRSYAIMKHIFKQHIHTI